MKRFEAQKAYLACLVVLTVFISIFSGCGGGGGGHWNAPNEKDTTRPIVTATIPATTIPGPTLGVPTNTIITVAFNKDMAPATLSAPGAFTVTGPGATPVPAAVPAVTYDAVSRTATFHPAAALTGGVTYTVTVKGTGASAAADTAGNALAGNPAFPLVANDYVWRFTTSLAPDTTRPIVTATVPATTIPGPTPGVPTNTIITVAFNENMAPATITAPGAITVTGPGTTPVSAAVPAVTYDVPSRTATFHPAAALTPGVTYIVTVKGTGVSAVTDSAVPGNALAGNPALPLVANDYVWSFTTSLPADTTRPVVTVTVPATTTPGPTPGVLTSTAITATFNENMAPATITAPGAITVTGPGTTPVTAAVPAVTYDVPSRTATFHPLAALTPGVTYTVTVKGTGVNAVTDSALPGNALAGNPALPLVANDYAWSFITVGAAPLLNLNSVGIASAGGITNTGATKINGNVVLDPTATCNFQPILFVDGPGFGVCGGNILNIPTVNTGDVVITQLFPDTVTADNVMAELLVKWNSISPAGLPGATVLGCGTIGSAGDAGALIGCSGNSTLPPGNYISATGTTIGVAGDLTLNGSATDVWVFQAPSALTTAVTSRIILTGGALSSNVWWFVGSSATINTGTVFEGNILASASITMGTGATSCGRLLAGAEGAGNFTFLGNTVSVPGHPNAPVGCQ